MGGDSLSIGLCVSLIVLGGFPPVCMGVIVQRMDMRALRGVFLEFE